MIMKLHYFRKICFTAALVAIFTGIGMDPSIAAKSNQTNAGEGTEVLTAGPVHEAFAETVTFDPQSGIVVPKAPPDAIEEIPPEEKPEGENVVWVPGYWAWDDDRSDFIWVSGVWRALPPGRQWVPGYWTKSEEGYQWISGYWANTTANEVEYLPEPPDTVEVGPNINAPSPDYGWIPGCWVWYLGRYAWRPGYWAIMQPDWVWVPAHYVWTPRGYIFVGGYWDYPVIRRGVLFAPVYFSFGVSIQPGFYFSPAIVISLDVFTDYLFWRPRYHHYYFGDYYASKYYRQGFYPWFSLHARRVGYDPIYAHQRWVHRHDREWEHRVEADFRKRRDHKEARPPRTWVTQREMSERGERPRDESRIIAAPLDHMRGSKDTSWRFRSLNEEERRKIGQHGKEVRKFRKERRELEARDKSVAVPARGLEPAREKLPRSPIMSKQAEKSGRDVFPPKRYKAPKPDTNVEPARTKPDTSYSPRWGRPGVTKDRSPQLNPQMRESGQTQKYQKKQQPVEEKKADKSVPVPARGLEPARREPPKSPIMSMPPAGEQPGRDIATPKGYKATKRDTHVEQGRTKTHSSGSGSRPGVTRDKSPQVDEQKREGAQSPKSYKKQQYLEEK